MRSLEIPVAPACLAALAVARPNGPWFDGSDASECTCRRETRDTLLQNQDQTCGWCQAKITLDASHVEHILPKSHPSYQHLTFEIENLIACCGNKTSPTCGHSKGERVIAAWLHPYHTPVLERYFSYAIDGKMEPAGGLDSVKIAEAVDAVDRVLNLNESVLKSQREMLISDLGTEPYEGLSTDEIFTVVGEFKSLIEQYAS
jgi:uncharacterized protein (TIGR02646 family)